MSATDGLARFLARLQLRSVLSIQESEAVLGLPAQLQQAAAHRDIVRVGDNVETSTLIIAGLAGRFDQLADGSRQITALHLPGDMCDLHSAVVPLTGWGIQALADCVIAKVPHQALRQLSVQFPGLALAFWRDTVVDGAILAKWLSALGRRSAQARLAHLLCEIGIRMELAGLGTRERFILPATQAQLADVLGITPVHFNRSLQALRAEGLVERDGAAVVIPQASRLCKLADFDPRYLLLPDPDEDPADAALAAQARVRAASRSNDA